MDGELSELLSRHIYGLVFFGLIALISNYLAYRWRYYRYDLDRSSPITILKLACVVLAFVGVSIVVSFLFLVAGRCCLSPTSAYGLFRWATPVVTVVILVVLALVGRLFGYPTYHWLWGQHKTNGSRLGLVSIINAGSIVYCLSNFLYIGLVLLYGPVPEEQDALIKLRQLLPYPAPFTALVICVVIIIPIIEELLFRGFLQGWLRRHLPRQPALWITAAIFGGVHFTIAQGVANIYLLPPLVILGWYLGHLFEKTGTLWSSITLHAVFNGIAVLLLFVSEVWI